MGGKAEPECEGEASGELVYGLEPDHAEERRRFILSTGDRNPLATPHFDMKSCRFHFGAGHYAVREKEEA